MPRPEYKRPNKETIYLDVDGPLKERFLDVCYLLNAKSQGNAFAAILKEYLENRLVPARPKQIGNDA